MKKYFAVKHYADGTSSKASSKSPITLDCVNLDIENGLEYIEFLVGYMTFRKENKVPCLVRPQRYKTVTFGEEISRQEARSIDDAYYFEMRALGFDRFVRLSSGTIFALAPNDENYSKEKLEEKGLVK